MDPIHIKSIKVHQNHCVSFKITENQWNNVEMLHLNVDAVIPDKLKHEDLIATFRISKSRVGLLVPIPLSIDARKVKVEVKCSLKSNDGQLFGTINCDEKMKMVELRNDFVDLWVYRSVEINPEKLYDKDRSFVVDVDVDIEVKDSLERTEVKGDQMGPCSLCRDIKSLNQDDDYSDFVIRVGGKVFRCHRNILSVRSNYFKVMLAGDNVESKTKSMNVREEDIPVETIEKMLNYIYTGETPSENNLDISLLNAANMFLLDELKEACITNLLAKMDIFTCLSTFVAVDKYLPVTSPVRSQVMKFMICKAAEIVELDECAELMKSYPDLARELMKGVSKMAKEKHGCEYCVITYKTK